jgi:hypothetical protein
MLWACDAAALWRMSQCKILEFAEHCPDRALGDVPTTLRNGILVQSKAFDAKTYLSTVHPQATFKDLSRGRENLKGPLGLSCVLLNDGLQTHWNNGRKR